MDNATEALSEFAAGKIDQGQLWRKLLGHDDWQVLPHTEVSGEQCLLMFPGPTTTKAIGGIRQGGQFTTTKSLGSDLVLSHLAGVERIRIDPGSPHEVTIPRADFSALKLLAEAMEIENAWKRLRDGRERADDLHRVAHYPHYHLAALRTERGFLMIHVPHDNGEMFVPIFTHTDALALGLEAFHRELPGSRIKSTEAGGAQMFPAIAKERAAGIVINHLGPPAPLAFRLGALDLMLEKLDQ